MAKTNSTIFENRTSGKKWMLYLSVVCSAIMDILLTVYLAVSGADLIKWIPIVVLTVADLLLILTTVKSNFRFAYSLTYPIIYMVITVACVVLMPFQWIGVFTMFAMIVFCLIHGVSVIALLLNVLSAANRGKLMKVFTFLITLIFTLATVACVGLTCLNGLFGQGGFGYRNVYYEYDASTDGYVAKDLATTSGNKLLIAQTYNDKKVTSIDCAILTAEGLEEIYFECEPEVELANAERLSFMSKDVTVHVAKEDEQALKTRLINFIKDGDEQYVSLYNSVVPVVSDGEVYITFDYSFEDMGHADFKLLSTWYGKTGDKFDVNAHGSDIDYAKDYNLKDEGYLSARYIAGEKVLSPLTENGVEIIGANITNSAKRVNVVFEDVFPVKIGDDNDTLYEQTAFKQYQTTGFRYIIESDPYNLLGSIEKRDGFNLSWKYSADGVSKTDLDSLKAVIRKTNLTVYPEWELKAPVITVACTNVANNTFTYGDNITLKADATEPVTGIDLSYNWKKTTNVADTKEHLLSNVKPDASGVYVLTVTASSSTLTSLTSSAESNVNVVVNKKPLGFEWILPEAVYSGIDKTIACNYVASDVINSDAIDFSINGQGTTITVKNVDTYNLSVALVGECDELYEIKSANKTKSFSVTPYQATLNWGTSTFTYNGNQQGPTASFAGVGSDGTINATVTKAKDAGNHRATASVSNSNYTIANPTQAFVINPKTITLTWNTATFTYNGSQQGPSATVSGVVSGESVALSYQGKQKDVGEYTITASTNNGNYVIDNPQKAFEITKKQISLTWATTSLTYNGSQQGLLVTSVSGEVSGEETAIINSITYSGKAKDAGSHTMTASLPAKTNYVINANKNKDYTIAQASVVLSWSNVSFVYDGQSHKPTAKVVSGVVGSDNVGLTVSGAETNVGNYTATATLSNGNYKISSGETTTFTIKAKEVTLTWPANNSFTASGSAVNYQATVGGVLAQDGNVVKFTYYSGSLALGSAPSTAGTYSVVASIENANYEFASTALTQKSFTITEASLA